MEYLILLGIRIQNETLKFTSKAQVHSKLEKISLPLEQNEHKWTYLIKSVDITTTKKRDIRADQSLDEIKKTILYSSRQ